MKPSIKFLGTGVLIQQSQMLTTEMRQAAEKELKKVGFKIANDGKKYCPVQTGRLRASITVNWSGSGKVRADGGDSIDQPHFVNDGVGQPLSGQGMGFVVVVGTNVEYSEPVHDRIPYLLAAFRDAHAGALHDLKMALAKVI